ncbi:hypothetical protein CDD83_10579 [Cordyceps sp. RAO-2017]|nr:hypothetical protein CDD83_10579 [Cordyceps sp. RAO-2017]
MTMLYRHVRNAGVRVYFNRTVAHAFDDADLGWVVFDNDDCISGDIILATNGIKSCTRPQILSDLGQDVRI